MDIIIIILASYSTVMGVLVLMGGAFKRFNHKGMALGGISYFAGGIISFYFFIWWPAALGIALTHLIKKVYGEPNYERKPDYGFAISITEANDNEKIEAFIRKFLHSDLYGKNFASDQYQKWTEEGYLYRLCRDLNIEFPESNNLVNWFIVYLRPKIKSLPSYTYQEYQKMINEINGQSGKYLEAGHKIAKSNNLNYDDLKSKTPDYLNQLSKKDRVDFFYSVFADNVIHTQLRILQYLYIWWYPKNVKNP